jgi:tetratricopeptide (TPR) repeat protein
MKHRGKAGLILGMYVCMLPGAMPAQSAAGTTSVASLYAKAKEAEAHNDAETAIRSYQQILRLDPSLAPAYNNLGSIYYDAGQYRKAIEVLQAGLRKDPKMAASHAVLGSAYLAVGESKNAIEQFSLAVKENPADARSEDLLEQTLISEQQYSLAAERLRARVNRFPGDQDAWYRLGRVYLQMSQDALSRAETMKPDSPVAHELQGELQENLGNLDAAQQEYELAVKEAPDKPGTHEHLGNLFWIQGLWPRAEAEFRAELANDSANCRAQWKLANSILNANENAEEALKVLESAVVRCPHLTQARVDRARALIAVGQAPEALDDLLLAEKADADEPTIHFLLEKLYRSEGKDVEAAAERRAFSELMDKHKRHPNSTASANVASPK